MAGISAEDYVWDVGREGVPVPLPISSGTSRRGLVTLYPCSIVLGFSGWLSRVRWAYALYLCQPMISGLVIPRGVALSYRPSTIPPLRFGFMFRSISGDCHPCRGASQKSPGNVTAICMIASGLDLSRSFVSRGAISLSSMAAQIATNDLTLYNWGTLAPNEGGLKWRLPWEKQTGWFRQL